MPSTVDSVVNDAPSPTMPEPLTRRPHPVQRDLLVIGGIALLSFLVASIFDFHERYESWLRQNGWEQWQLDELVTAVTITGLAVGAFALRRWLELRRALAGHDRAASELRQRTGFLQLQQVLATTANEAANTAEALRNTLDIVCAYTGWHVGHAFVVTPGPPVELEPADIWYVRDPAQYAPFQQRTRTCRFTAGVGLPGLVYAQRKAIWLENVDWLPGAARAESAKQIGLRAGFAFPVWVGQEIVAVLEFFTDRPTPSDKHLTHVLNYIGTQLGRVVERERAAAARRNSEEKFRALIENGSDIISILEPDGTIRYQSPSIEHILGYRPDKLIGTNAFALVHPDDLARLQQTFAEGITQPNCIRIEQFRHRHRDGTWRIFDAVGRNLINDKTIAGIVVNSRDITARRQAEEALLESASCYRLLFENHPLPLWVFDVETLRFLAVNNAAINHYGYTHAEFLAMTAKDIRPAEDLPAFLEDVAKRRRGIAHPGIWRHRKKNGDIIRVEIATHSIDFEGRQAIIVMANDVTKRERAEEQLRLQSSALSAAANSIVITGADGTILWVNPAFTTLTGYTSTEVIGQNPRLLKSGQQAPEFYRSMWQTISSGRVWRGEIINSRKDGTPYTEDMTITPVRADRGDITHFIAIKQDVTDRQRAAAALQESNRRLTAALAELKTAEQQVIQQERLRALGTMAGGIAHDFNNSLASILGFSELLLYRPDNLNDREKTKRYLELMNIAARDAGNIVSRLRQFYRHRDDDEVFVPVDLNPLIQDAISLTRPKWEAEAQSRGINITVRTELAPLPLLIGSGSELREAFTNLIFNAVDALPHDGTITVRSRRDDGHVVVEVTDTGTGMSEDVQRRCLEPFFSTKGERGTGLGLSMVYGILQRHAGTIDIASEPGRGTTFFLRLPIPTESKATNAPATSTPGALRPLRILLVDDESQVRDILTEFLTGDGHTVSAACTGAEALEKFHAHTFDVAVLDRAMPGMSGDQLAVALKADAPALPVIMLTGFGTMMQAANEHPTGVNFIVSKPVTIQQLRVALAQATTGSV